jgi:hypothetical protein
VSDENAKNLIAINVIKNFNKIFRSTRILTYQQQFIHFTKPFQMPSSQKIKPARKGSFAKELIMLPKLGQWAG